MSDEKKLIQYSSGKACDNYEKWKKLMEEREKDDRIREANAKVILK